MGEMNMRKIIHVDMDCFYAAVEMRDNPQLRDVPIAIGGSAKQRGVISTANYPARKYGVRSAMSTAMALKLCPGLILLPDALMPIKRPLSISGKSLPVIPHLSNPCRWMKLILMSPTVLTVKAPQR